MSTRQKMTVILTAGLLFSSLPGLSLADSPPDSHTLSLFHFDEGKGGIAYQNIHRLTSQTEMEAISQFNIHPLSD